MGAVTYTLTKDDKVQWQGLLQDFKVMYKSLFKGNRPLADDLVYEDLGNGYILTRDFEEDTENN
jgi:hypothetical protein